MSNILALDISLKATGWAYFENGVLKEYGVIPEPKYAGKSKDRYPQRSAKVGKLMTEEILKLVSPDIDYIVIEEASSNGKMGIKSIKSLVQIHGMLLYFLDEINLIDKVSLMSPSGTLGWRPILNLKKNGCFKKASVLKANTLHNLTLNDSEHDIADAILIGTAFIYKLKDGN